MMIGFRNEERLDCNEKKIDKLIAWCIKKNVVRFITFDK